jgi:hypothetical protein
MGQITTAEIGVSVSLSLTYENIKLILSLLEMRMDISPLITYVSGINENDDEIQDYENEFEIDFLEEFRENMNEEEYISVCKKLELKSDLTFHFIYNCLSIYADNISYRQTCRLFNTFECSPKDLIDSIQKGTNIFRSANIPEHLILIGNSMYDG